MLSVLFEGMKAEYLLFLFRLVLNTLNLTSKFIFIQTLVPKKIYLFLYIFSYRFSIFFVHLQTIITNCTIKNFFVSFYS